MYIEKNYTFKQQNVEVKKKSPSTFLVNVCISIEAVLESAYSVLLALQGAKNKI